FAIIIKIGLLGIFCCFAGRQCLDKCTALAFSKIENIQKILIENFLSAHRFNFRHFFVVNDGFTVLVDGMNTHINCIKQLFIKFIHVDGCLNVILIAHYVITFMTSLIEKQLICKNIWHKIDRDGSICKINLHNQQEANVLNACQANKKKNGIELAILLMKDYFRRFVMCTNTKDIIKQTEKYGAQNYKPLPVVISEAEGVWVKDPEGNQYMDMLSSYSALNQG